MSPTSRDNAREDGRDEAARDRLAALGEIAAEIAHELRNVLQVVAASAYLARQDPHGAEGHIAKVERNTRLAQSIVDDLMALARGEALHAERVDVRDVVDAARAELPAGGASWVDAELPAGLQVRAHPALLTRVLHALYENAIQVCAPRPPTIATRAYAEEGATVLEVEDDGPGVPPALAPHLFTPLASGRAGGSGLGLALARRIVDAHGGTIALAARSGEGKGARFVLRLPSR